MYTEHSLKLPVFSVGTNQHYLVKNVWFDITSDIFKEGQQMYIQMKAYVLPFKNIISFFNLANAFIP